MATIPAVNPEAHSRTRRLAAVGIAAVVGGVLVAVAVLSSGGGDPEPGLTIERLGAGGGPELVVYVTDRRRNTPATSRGKRAVTLECVDGAGKVLLRLPQDWPFGFPDGRNLDPHVHQPVSSAVASRVTRCRLAGTRPLLEGEIGGPAIR